jgi:hypothetical protein
MNRIVGMNRTVLHSAARYFSSQSGESPSNAAKAAANLLASQHTLFHRGGMNRFAPSNPSFMLAASYFHTGYWTWYVTSFNPALIAAGVDGVDVRVGYVGFVLAFLMNSGAAVYAKHLVSNIDVRNGILRVQAHTLPLGLPEAKSDKNEMYRVGEIKIPKDDKRPNEGISMLRKESGYTYQPLRIQNKERQGWRLAYLLDIDNAKWPMGDVQGYNMLHHGRTLSEEELVSGGSPDFPKRKRHNPAQRRKRK